MGENSKIEWCHHTFNPWIGCTKVSPGCDNCYAEAMAKRYGWVTWGPHGERRRTKTWLQPFAWNAAAYRAKTRYRVFCASLADWLDNQAPQAWRIELAEVITKTPHLDWLLLTKRIENYGHLAPWIKAPSNVWLGITCVDQAEFDRDWPKLRDVNGPAVRFVSYEPALGPLEISFGLMCPGDRVLNWVICGGESGPHARPMNPQWARDLRDECRARRVAFFYKQNGEWASVSEVEGEGEHFHFADGRTVRRVGKKKAGRLLDGIEHSEFPVTPAKAEAA